MSENVPYSWQKQLADLPHDWQERLNKASAEGRLHGGIECCGTRGMQHLPFCRSGIPSNTMTLHGWLGLPEPPKEKTTVPLVVYKDDGERVVIGTASLLEDGTAQMTVQDKKFLGEHFKALDPRSITDGLSIGLKLQEFSIAASIDSPPVVKWTLKDPIGTAEVDEDAAGMKFTMKDDCREQ